LTKKCFLAAAIFDFFWEKQFLENDDAIAKRDRKKKTMIIGGIYIYINELEEDKRKRVEERLICKKKFFFKERD
jgi:hypothetical protein